MKGSEEHRHKWALGLATTLSLIIFVTFGFYKGYITFDNSTNSTVTMGVVSVEEAPSPIQNYKNVFSGTIQNIKKQYDSLKDSMASVFVPFITSIEVYDRVEK